MNVSSGRSVQSANSFSLLNYFAAVGILVVDSRDLEGHARGGHPPLLLACTLKMHSNACTYVPHASRISAHHHRRESVSQWTVLDSGGSSGGVWFAGGYLMCCARKSTAVDDAESWPYRREFADLIYLSLSLFLFSLFFSLSFSWHRRRSMDLGHAFDGVCLASTICDLSIRSTTRDTVNLLR